MVHLEAHDALTFFSGPEKELEKMLVCLRIKDPRGFWKAKAILRRLAYLPPDVRNARVEQIKQSSQWIKFYNLRNKSFGTGLLGLVRKHLKTSKLPFRVKDCRRHLPVQDPEGATFIFQDKIEDRPEQVKALRAALKAGRGILHCATNAGKTEIAAGIVAWVQKRLRDTPRTLFLVHRKDLAIQTAERFRKHLSVKVSIIFGGSYKPSDITVATVQTASRLLKKSAAFRYFLETCDILFIDEFHVNKAKQASAVFNRCAAPMRFGLSGTISKNPEKLMYYRAATGGVLAKITNEELIELGRSAKPIIRMVGVGSKGWWCCHHEKPEHESWCGIGRQRKDSYAAAYLQCIVHSDVRNEKVLSEIKRHLNKDRRVLVTVDRIRHGHILRRMCQRAELECNFISGSTSMPLRKQARSEFTKGRVPILIVSSIFNVGIDLPAIDGWVNAAAGKGWELCLQRVGRTLRRKSGQNVVYISDFMDYGNKYLLKHSRLRLRYYREEGFQVKVIE